jgi:nitroreductase
VKSQTALAVPDPGSRAAETGGRQRDVLTVIAERRATRSYTEEEVDRGTIERLLDAAVQAPSAMHLEPWAFVVFEGRDRLRQFSEEAKCHLLQGAGESLPAIVRTMLVDPAFNIFYGAPALIVICATSAEPQAAEDCCLAAQNIMLAAHAAGLATCPIGFARSWLNSPATKRKFGISENLVPVFPVILGHAEQHPDSPGRRAPVVFWR